MTFLLASKRKKDILVLKSGNFSFSLPDSDNCYFKMLARIGLLLILQAILHLGI